MKSDAACFYFGGYPWALRCNDSSLERVVCFIKNEGAKYGRNAEESGPNDEPTRETIYWIELPEPPLAGAFALGLPTCFQKFLRFIPFARLCHALATSELPSRPSLLHGVDDSLD